MLVKYDIFFQILVDIVSKIAKRMTHIEESENWLRQYNNETIKYNRITQCRTLNIKLFDFRSIFGKKVMIKCDNSDSSMHCCYFMVWPFIVNAKFKQIPRSALLN